jgi:hypothetical protein
VEELKKGRGGKHQGLVCIRHSYWVTEKTGRRANKPYYVKDARQWVLPLTALTKIRDVKPGEPEVVIDESEMRSEGISIPSPEDTTRIHEHDFVKKPHPVDEIHADRQAQKASLKELAEYWNVYHNGDPDRINRRLHSHNAYSKVHPVDKKHEGENVQIEHRNEQLKFEQALFGRDSKEQSWLDDPKMQVTPVRLNFQGDKIEGQKYARKGKDVYIFEWHNAAFVYTEKDGYRVFSGKRPTVEALEHIQSLFDHKQMKKSLDILKSDIINKIGALTSSDPDSKIDSSIVLNKFKNGEDEVILAGLNGKYSVAVNGTPIINTDNFTKAISKYYSLISSTIEAKAKNKDMGLEIFGDKLLEINRAIRPLVEKLGDRKAAMFLFDFDYSDLDWPFSEEQILKAELPRTMQIGMVPSEEELGYAGNDYGMKPSKDKDESVGQEDKRESSQKPIEEKEDKGISPVSVTI